MRPSLNAVAVPGRVGMEGCSLDLICFGGTSFVDLFMFLFCLVFAMSLCASVYMCFVVTYWERADLLAIVCCV